MLKGFTVINLASVGPAARAAQTLADFGAKVIHVSPVSTGVQIEPVFYAYGAGRGTKKICIDLKSDKGREVFIELVRDADVLIESFRPGVVKRLSIDYETLKTVNRNLVYCSTSGYGQSGPYSQWAGHDINYLAMSGYLDCSGRDDNGNPALAGATIADSAGGGQHACMSIMAALLAGEGRYLDVAVTEGVLSLMSLNIDKFLATQVENTTGTDLLTGRYAWYGVYRCADNQWISVGAIEGKFYTNLCQLLGLDEFVGKQYDDQAQATLRKRFTEHFLTRNRDEWVSMLASQDTCVAPVLSVSQVAEDKHFKERACFQTATHKAEGDFSQLGRLLAGADRHANTYIDGEKSQPFEILSEFGYENADINRLVEEGIVE